MTRSYDFSHLHVGMELKSFAELCRIVGGNPKAKGNSRASMIKEFERHIVWEKARPGSNAIAITEIYEKPLPKKMRADNKYDMDVLTCLQWADQKWRVEANAEERSYTMRDLLVLCGFTSNRWNQIPSKAKAELREAFRNGIPKSSEAQMFKFLNDLSYHVNNYCGNVIDRSLERLVRDGNIEYVRKWYLVEDSEGFRDATPHEQGECERLYSEVKESLQIKRPNLYTSSGLYKEVNMSLWKSLKLRRAFKTRRVALTPTYPLVTREDYLAAAGRINALSVEQFERCIENDRDKKIAEVQEAIDGIDDSETLEILELFEITALDVEGTRSDDLEMEGYFRDALVSWFIKRDGAAAYISKKKEIDARLQEHFKATRIGCGIVSSEQEVSPDPLNEEAFSHDNDLAAYLDALFADPE